MGRYLPYWGREEAGASLTRRGEPIPDFARLTALHTTRDAQHGIQVILTHINIVVAPSSVRRIISGDRYAAPMRWLKRPIEPCARMKKLVLNTTNKDKKELLKTVH